MKTRIGHKFFSAILAVMMMAVLIAVCANTVTAGQSSGVMDSDESALFDLINAARRDPLGMAESMGMNRAEVLKSLPELKDILVHGLPELGFNDRLYQTAGEHTQDMLKNSYYAYESADGKSPEQRMEEAGYVAAHGGEALGLIFFNNFIDSSQAVFQIFENMFKDELSPEMTGQRHILNPDFEDLGVGIGGGLYRLNEISGNVYLATCDFGASVEIYDLQLFMLINQLRVNPVAVARFLGVEVSAILELFPEYTDFFANGLPPLAFNSQLYAAAGVQINDMLENEYWGHVSPEGVTPVMRIRAQGYLPTWAAESKTRLSTCFNVVSPENTVQVIFKNMFFNAFKKQGFRDASMLAKKAVEGGLHIKAAESKALSGICGDNVHIAVGDFGASAVNAGPVLSGVIYEDVNENGLYDVGEEVAGAAVSVKTPGVVEPRIIQTNAAGGYMVRLAAGWNRVSVGAGGNEQIKWVAAETVNVWQPFQVAGEKP